MVSFGFLNKKLFGTLPPLLNKPMGFITKLLEKQLKDAFAKYSRCLVAKIMRCGFIAACILFIEFSINFKRGRGQNVFSISQIT